MTPLNSALPRVLDPRYPSNRLALAGLVGGVVLGRLRGHGWAGSLKVGLLGFSAWATARELDPDHPQTAALALPAALLPALLARPSRERGVMGLLDVAPALGALSATRVLSASVGLPPAPVDVAALGAMGLAAGGSGAGLPSALLPAAGLALTRRPADRWSPDHLPGLKAALAASALAGLWRGPRSGGVLDAALALGALAVAPDALAPESPRSVTDEGGEPLSAQRLQLARSLAAGSLALGLLGPRRDLRTPLAAALLSLGLRRRDTGKKALPPLR